MSKSFNYINIITIKLSIDLLNKILKFDCLDFLYAFQNFRNQIFKIFTICYIQQKYNIVSFNLVVVLEFLKERRRKKLIKRFALQTILKSNKHLTQISQESKLIKRNLQALQLHYQKNKYFDMNFNQMFNILKSIKQQSKIFTLYKQNLNNYLAIILL